MNKKTFTVAVIFLIVTLVWLGVNIFWAKIGKHTSELQSPDHLV